MPSVELVQQVCLEPHDPQGQDEHPTVTKNGVHAPAMHTSNELHAYPHMPQLWISVWSCAVVRQFPLQWVVPEGHVMVAQIPDTQTWLAPHMFVQLPQWVPSELTS
jgi:hypothetical protein